MGIRRHSQKRNKSWRRRNLMVRRSILKTRIRGHSQQTIHNGIANNEWSGAGFPKLRLPGPCEQVFGFSRSLCSCGSFLLLCSHGFQRSFSRSRKGGPMYCITRWNEQSSGYPWAAMDWLQFCAVCRVYHKLYLRRLWDGRNAAEMAVLRGLWDAGSVLLAVAALFV